MPEETLDRAEAPPAGLEESLGWVGAKLDDVGGHAVGRLDAILVDARDGTPTWVVVRLGRFGARCAVPHELVAGGAGRAWTSLPREVIRAAADVDPGGGLDCEGERALAGRYGLAVRPPCSEASSDVAGSVPAAS
jgi:hypothetical protein